MRVFNTEVKQCAYCPHFYYEHPNYYMYHCMYGRGISNLGDPDIIHKDCPFSKALTKEDIESLGFVHIPKYDCSTNAYLLTTNKEFPVVIGNPCKLDWLLEAYTEKGFIIHAIKRIAGVHFESLMMDGQIRFVGTINNKPELEFILKSLNIIE